MLHVAAPASRFCAAPLDALFAILRADTVLSSFSAVAAYTLLRNALTFATTSDTGKCTYVRASLASSSAQYGHNQSGHTLAIATCILPSRSPFHSSLPSSPPIAPTTSFTTVPRRSVGMSPLGPRKRASRAVICGSIPGVLNTLLGSISPERT